MALGPGPSMGLDRRKGRGTLMGIMRKILPTPVGGCIPHRTWAMQDAGFYEKALFVKPTWGLPRGRVQRRSLPFERYASIRAVNTL
jgi:hypothetical protein